MPMPAPATVAALIASDLAIPDPTTNALTITQWTAILTRIQAMVQAATVTVSVPGATAGPATLPGTGTIT